MLVDAERRLPVDRIDTDSIDGLGHAPSETAIEPLVITDDRLAGGGGGLVKPTDVPKWTEWHPQQDVISVERRVVADHVKDLERLSVPQVERVPSAPDIIPPVDRGYVGVYQQSKAVEALPLVLVQLEPEISEIAEPAAKGSDGQLDAKPLIQPVKEEGEGEFFEEEPPDVTELKPVEDLLRADIRTYTTFKDFKYGYFRIDITRAGAEVLPVIPKDVLLVQDCSASMAEQRLYFCRDGLTNCLFELKDVDRFNVVAFRDKIVQSFYFGSCGADRFRRDCQRR